MTASVRLFDTVVAHPATVVEASAGTGKTYQLEHLILDLIAEGRATIDQILVVTFTERATNELQARVRKTLEAAAAVRSPSPHDEAARARLVEARRAFDQAAITTIHAFCQRLLTEEPLTTGRLLGQAQVEPRAAFGEAFRDVLRRSLATDNHLRPYLQAFLQAGRSVEGLESLLFRAAQARGCWATVYDEPALVADITALAGVNFPMLALPCKAIIGHSSKVNSFNKRTNDLIQAAVAAQATRDWATFLAALDERAGEGFPDYVQCLNDATSAGPAVQNFARLLARLVAQPSLAEAIAQTFLPLVQAALAERKLGHGLYDFDDMIATVATALRGPAGDAWVATLRQRFRFALIDEAQDTESAQWRIFERIFLRSGGANPVVLVGDPKQAIYGFRGADVHTYVAARADVDAHGGARVNLDVNRRSADEVVQPVNAILDQQADPPFFSNPDIRYDHPVTSARGSQGRTAGVTLFKLDLPERPEKPLRVGPIKAALRNAIGDTIAALRDTDSAFDLATIFVLTRTNIEARELGDELGARGIPHSFYKQEGLWKTPEAAHVRALLHAIDDPSDRVARMQAWLTPFFGATLRQLEAMGEPPVHHPLIARLHAWKALADERDYAALWTSVVESTGLGPRHHLGAVSQRRLGIYRQIIDELLAESAARPLSVGELAATIGRYESGRFPPSREGAAQDRDIQRAALDGNAVQLLTMHRAKGLEAEHVFIYGALSGGGFWKGNVHAFHRGHQRVFCAEKPRQPTVLAAIKTAQVEEDQRLLYVAMTRARHRLYLPFFPNKDADDTDMTEGNPFETDDYTTFDKIKGAYRHINERLRTLAAEPRPFSALFDVRLVPFPAPERGDNAALAAALGAWTPAALTPPGTADDPRRAALRTSRRGFTITSYSRLKDAEGGYQAPTLDETPPPTLPNEVSGALPLELPGGAATGLFLHAVLEHAPLGALAPLPLWQRLPEIERLFETQRRRWDRETRHLDAAARLVHAALTTPIALPDGSVLPGIARAARVRREVDFLFPMRGHLDAGAEAGRTREDRLVVDRGFIRGVLDVVFEHEGKVYLADWKSDALPDFSPAALRAQIAANYELQIQIYTVALFRLLGIRDQGECDRLFGGLVYVFLRGLGDDPARDPEARQGLYVSRPTFAEVRAWERALVSPTTRPAPEPR